MDNIIKCVILHLGFAAFTSSYIDGKFENITINFISAFKI